MRLLSTAVPYPATSDLADALCIQDMAKTSLMSFKAGGMCHHKSEPQSPCSTLELQYEATYREYRQIKFFASFRLALLLTDKAFLGPLPANGWAGDQLALLAGGQTPYVGKRRKKVGVGTLGGSVMSMGR